MVILGLSGSHQLTWAPDDVFYLREELGVRMSRRDKLILRCLASEYETTMADVIRRLINQEARALVAGEKR